MINCGLLKALTGLITTEQRAPIKRELCWTLSNITAGSKEQIELVINANLIRPLINAMKTDKYEIAKEAFWCLSNATR